MSRPSLYLFLAIAALCNCCVFETDETYFLDLQPPDGSDAALSIEALNGSTLYKPETIYMKVLPSGKQHYEALIQVDGYTLYSLTSTTGEFWFALDPARFQEGERKLDILIAYPTLSPSLGGQLGAEIMTLSTTYTFMVDRSPPSKIAAPVVYVEDGKSMLEWQKPDKFNFSELILLRTYYKNGVYQGRDSIKIADFNTTVYHDISYVGGQVTYRVDIKGYQFYIQGGETSFNINPLTLSIDSLSTPVKLKWKKSALYNNKIRIIYGNMAYPPDQEQAIDLHARFGQPDYVTVTIRPLDPPQPGWPSYELTMNKDVFVGIKTEPFHHVEYLASKDVYLSMNGGVLRKINAQNYQTTGALQVPGSDFSGLCVSPDGQHCYVYQGDKLYLINVDGMGISETINLTSIIGSNQGFRYSPTVSNDNFATIDLYTKSRYVIDLNSKSIVWTNETTATPVISPDGQYIHCDGMIYKKQNGNWDAIHGTVAGPHEVNTAVFRQDSKQQFMMSKSGASGILVYDLATLQQTSTLELLSNFQYDRHTETFMDLQASSYLGTGYIYDDEHTLTRTLEIVYEPSRLFYVNGHFFHGSGAILP